MVGALFGYDVGTQIAHIAFYEGITCKEAALREHLLTKEQAEDLFDTLSLTDRRKMEALYQKYSALRNV